MFELLYYENLKKNPQEMFNVIREKYAYWKNIILNGDRPSPYFLEWHYLFTPIERNVWSAIREFGIPMYPQYPVSKYFIDFADPLKKIGIECDGKLFHNHKKDCIRDQNLKKIGWEIIRIPGEKCVKYSHFEDINFDKEKYYFATPEGIIARIKNGRYSENM